MLILLLKLFVGIGFFTLKLVGIKSFFGREMKIFEIEVRRLKIFCLSDGCMNPNGGHRSTHRNVKDFSDKSKLEAIEAFELGIRINATTTHPTQGKWKKTKKGWLCPECK